MRAAYGTPRFHAVKVFSATMPRDRNRLGETITAWLEGHPTLCVVDTAVMQSSDSDFHCVSFILWLAET